MLTVGSLFSGIGGLDLGLERAGMNVIWQSEIDPYCSRVLKKHWPEVPNYGDIKKINWREIERPNIICGGYPCQPFSTAGKRRGTNDPRHLWPWVREAISELRPDYAILENVRGHLSMGGLQVVGELASIGYDAEWRVVSAASVGANHRRDRVFIVAYPNGSHSTNGGQRQALPSENSSWGNERARSGSDTRKVGVESTRQNKGYVANPDNSGERAPTRNLDEQTSESSAQRGNTRHELGRCSAEMADTNGGRQQKRNAQKRGLPVFNAGSTRYKFSQWEVEPNVGRVANGISDRVDRLRGLGNAVVPQVAETIGRLVMEASCHR
jgi:DNA (cytosine-5)-methyltransferase 1